MIVSCNLTRLMARNKTWVDYQTAVLPTVLYGCITYGSVRLYYLRFYTAVLPTVLYGCITYGSIRLYYLRFYAAVLLRFYTAVLPTVLYGCITYGSIRLYYLRFCTAVLPTVLYGCITYGSIWLYYLRFYTISQKAEWTKTRVTLGRTILDLPLIFSMFFLISVELPNYFTVYVLRL